MWAEVTVGEQQNLEHEKDSVGVLEIAAGLWFSAALSNMQHCL